MPVHFTGYMTDMRKVNQLSDKYAIPVIEDACQSILGAIDGKNAGTWSLAGAFSLHPLKNINVWSDGGVIVTDDAGLNEELILVFDDYGLPKPPHREKDVKDAVDQCVNEYPTFDLVKYVGEEKGSDCRPGKLLKAEEGVICRYRNVPLQTFWRIVDNQVHPVHEMEYLGFEKSEGLRIPDEYLDKQEFMVIRTAHGIGDWGIISAMPRLLKEKYPNSKVVVPSKKLLKKLFGQDHNNVHVVFDNNHFVDEFVD